MPGCAHFVLCGEVTLRFPPLQERPESPLPGSGDVDESRVAEVAELCGGGFVAIVAAGSGLAELVDMLGTKRPRIVFSTGAPEEIPPEIAEMGPVFEKPYDPAQLADVLASGAKPGLFARLRNAIS